MHKSKEVEKIGCSSISFLVTSKRYSSNSILTMSCSSPSSSSSSLETGGCLFLPAKKIKISVSSCFPSNVKSLPFQTYKLKSEIASYYFYSFLSISVSFSFFPPFTTLYTIFCFFFTLREGVQRFRFLRGHIFFFFYKIK